MATGIVAAEIDYPDSDGKPVAETDVHIDLTLSVRERLKARYEGRDDVYAAGNLMVYYQEGDPAECLAPDGFVAFGVSSRNRRSFKTWVEGVFPAVVFEWTSESTRTADFGDKLEVYRDIWKVKEYFLFDPRDEYLEPRLLGYRRVKTEFRVIRPTRGVLASRALGITLQASGRRLILRDAVTGAELLTRSEIRAELEARRAETAEAEVARLKAELAALQLAALRGR